MATNQGDAGGPSLFQARHNHHNHNHHNHNHHQHLHLHQHRRLHHPEADTTSPHIRSPPNEKLHGRQVVVVETVSVVHYIDATGAVTSVETLSTDPVAPTTAPAPLLPPAAPAGLSSVVEALPSVSLSGLIPDLTDGAPSSTSSAESETSSSSSLSASSETLTSTPFDSSSAFPTLSGAFNSSSTYIPSSSLFSNHSIALFSNSSRAASSTRSTFASTSTTSTTTSSPLWTSTANHRIHTVAAGPGGDGANAGTGAGAQGSGPDSAAPAPEEAPSGLAPETRNAVVGGVVGSVAGVALVVAVLLYLFKWRRQRGQGIMLLGDGDSTTRGRAFSSPGPAGHGGGGGMTERSGPFAIPSALAKLSNKRAIDAPPAGSASQEKGFYRVSGKKLVSVLESGGDGYTDPHDSIGSASSYYRDSQAFSENSTSSPLQLGSPMRPVSGVPVFRDGPQRMTAHANAPVPAGDRRSVFPTTLPLPDAVGRSFASQDGSRGSRSRFTEDA